MTKRKLMKMRKEALKVQKLAKDNTVTFNPTLELLKQLDNVLILTQYLIDQSLIKEK